MAAPIFSSLFFNTALQCPTQESEGAGTFAILHQDGMYGARALFTRLFGLFGLFSLSGLPDLFALFGGLDAIFYVFDKKDEEDCKE